jgi:hypothetical protein
MFTDENMEASNNQDRDEDFLDDFMWCTWQSFPEDKTFAYVLPWTASEVKDYTLYILRFTYHGRQLIWVQESSLAPVPYPSSYRVLFTYI